MQPTAGCASNQVPWQLHSCDTDAERPCCANQIGTSHYQQGPLHLERAQLIDGRHMQRRIAACAAVRVAMTTMNSDSDDAALPRARECGADGRQLPPSGRCAQPVHRPAFRTQRVNPCLK